MNLLFLLPAYVLSTTFGAILEITFWPWTSLLDTLITKLKYAHSKSENKKKCMEKVDYKEEQSTRAHLLEVCLEASFQVIELNRPMITTKKY